MHASLNALADSYRQLLAPLSASQTQLHPNGDTERWNASQLVEHLILTYRSTDRVLEERLAKGRPTQAPVTEKYRLWQEALFSTGTIPEKGKAPAAVTPGQLALPSLDGAGLANLFGAELEDLDRWIERCRQSFGEGIVATHLALGPLTAEQWRMFHVIHTKHHLLQLVSIVHSVTGK